MPPQPFLGSLRLRIVRTAPEPLCRLLMAASGLLALELDPPDFTIAPSAIAPLLLGYLLFAAWLLARELRGLRALAHAAWADLAWCLALTAVSGGTSSVLFFFLLLPIMSHAFRDGYSAGWTMTWVTTAGFLAVGLPTSPGGILFEVNRAMIRPLTLLILGYMIAREGGVQIGARKRLSLLARIDTVANPRFGVDRTLLNAAEQLRTAYGVRECVIVLQHTDSGGCILARATADHPATETLPPLVAAPLLTLPQEALIVYSPRGQHCLGASTEAVLPHCQGLGDLLEAQAFASVPMSHGGRSEGRIFLVGDVLPPFDDAELKFLAEAGMHLAHIVEKVALLDRLASLAAERERRRMAHDLHDRAIQPYLGLQLGLEAALRRPECPPALVDELRGLQRLAHQSAGELRTMLDGRRVELPDEDLLRDSIARLTQEYRDRFSIELACDCPSGFKVNDRLAVDLVGLISEGLSNVRRHTASRWARLSLQDDGGTLRLALTNERPPWGGTDFVPKSIRNRARELGGDARVDQGTATETTVRVHIPL
ncbi:sensor histidine kinase [Aromatoleum toluclasticum]|uniref:sensor histidine kinase n=1 Tax=Aromatoleum toluclasticum TaxID=92003 RepID=UPI001D1942CF|nr:histidine kinase [Aromatoleum toluclasticum]